jgi:hypothetical protein
MSSPPTPDGMAIFTRTALGLAEAFRGLAHEREGDREAKRDLLAAAEAVEKAIGHLNPKRPALSDNKRKPHS